MLCQFTFKNFRSYRDETIFDFQATAIPEFSDTLLGGDKGGAMLPAAVIYGPNGGGKSNLLQALSCLISTVVRPIYDLKKTRCNIVIQQSSQCDPFAFDDVSRDMPTEFEIYFRSGANEYRYELALKNDNIVHEALYWRAIGGKRTGTLFEREKDGISLGHSLSRSGLNRSVNPKMPYLSFLAINYDISMITEVQRWFESCIIRNYGNPMIDKRVMVSYNANVKKRIIEALNDIGIDLSGYRFDESENQLYTQRALNGKIYELPLYDESDGTKKLIAALPVILLALDEGRLVIIDELDAKLHPKLLRYIIMLFKNKNINRNGAQLIFTSQDMTTMKNTVFRRDEIWFSALNEDHASELYSLYEIRREDNERVNNTAAYDKQYLEGRYGADPYLRNMITGGEWK